MFIKELNSFCLINITGYLKRLILCQLTNYHLQTLDLLADSDILFINDFRNDTESSESDNSDIEKLDVSCDNSKYNKNYNFYFEHYYKKWNISCFPSS